MYVCIRKTLVIFSTKHTYKAIKNHLFVTGFPRRFSPFDAFLDLHQSFMNLISALICYSVYRSSFLCILIFAINEKYDCVSIAVDLTSSSSSRRHTGGMDTLASFPPFATIFRCHRRRLTKSIFLSLWWNLAVKIGAYSHPSFSNSSSSF